MTDNLDSNEGNSVVISSKKDITFKGLSQATIETFQLLRTHPDKMTYAGSITLVGMKAAFPERFSNEQLLRNKNFRFYNCLVWLGLEINDAVDIIPKARQEGRQELVENIFQEWKLAYRSAENAADLDPDQLDSNLQIMENYQREILFLEKTIRDLPTNQIDYSSVCGYRELMNAIGVIHNAAALFGSQEISQRTFSIPKEDLSFNKIQEKYAWIINGSYANETERKLVALYNTCMGVQVVDDWNDINDDQYLGLHTFATEIFAKHQGDVESAKKRSL